MAIIIRCCCCSKWLLPLLLLLPIPLLMMAELDTWTDIESHRRGLKSRKYTNIKFIQPKIEMVTAIFLWSRQKKQKQTRHTKLFREIFFFRVTVRSATLDSTDSQTFHAPRGEEATVGESCLRDWETRGGRSYTHRTHQTKKKKKKKNKLKRKKRSSLFSRRGSLPPLWVETRRRSAVEWWRREISQEAKEFRRWSNNVHFFVFFCIDSLGNRIPFLLLRWRRLLL